MNSGSGPNVVGFQCLVIGKLFPRVNQSDLIYLDSFLFLQGLLDRQDLVLWFKVEGLFPTCQSFDENLQTKREGEGRSGMIAVMM